VRLDHLERLVRERGAVDGDLASHPPRRMLQGVRQRRVSSCLRVQRGTARPTP
jgi:hypothetical protein